MNFFGIGWEEMMVIMVVALIVFGPGKLPEVMGQVGKAVRDFRRMTTDLTGEFEKTIGTSLDDVKQQVTGSLTGITSEVTSVTDSVKRDLNKAASEVVSTTSSINSTLAGTSSSARPGSAGSPVFGSAVAATAAVGMATKADPLADVSLLDDAVLIAKPASNGHAEPASEVTTDTVIESATEPVVVAADGAATNGNHHATGALTDDALARARQRRLAARYNRRVS